ncbi:hypothetical protein M413DRAFT_26991 [Hebeloma cylindrosporum]|uniref:Uncharacterized protein n=1 Tax=Hebeloma cylindrosporum TaxID=76867 RepID=A0A0C3CD93_HEBCY|nr:hypothetical protein M413DRAFT_26991 [Hebeloma cylindrosporum h7]
MVVASPFIQYIVRLYAYSRFFRKVAQYYKEASKYQQQLFLLFDAYKIFRDRWPTSDIGPVQFYDRVHDVIPRVEPIHLGDTPWFDEFNLEKDRRERVSPFMLVVTNLEACANPAEKLSLQEYASRWGLGYLTFPENTASGDIPPDDQSSNSDASEDGNNSDNGNESCSDNGEGDDENPPPEWYLQVMSRENEEDVVVDTTLPPPRRRKVTLRPQA